MPELPEVEIITKELQDTLVGDKIMGYDVRWHKTLKIDADISLTGREIRKFTRKGKYIIVQLDKGLLIIHLRMTGKFLIAAENAYSRDHLRVLFQLASNRFLLFYDIRKFGRIYFTDNMKDVLKNVGIDLLSREFTKDKLEFYIRRSRVKLKSFLMDQKYFAGLGNIYTDESLFTAGLHPEVYQNNLSADDINNLYNAIRKTLRKSIANMGTSISDYRNTNNFVGSNQHYLQVYGREHKPCFICECMIKRIKINNRSTFFCPNCQKI
jgi:formamidopyrimidine-DNA glycosylase